ncbi:carbohydrate sulfotransferase 11-like [Anneissia japonica]|uniref:carbohydrate sulfotransferase 11-like n=1 Tax=Anneissia japonica TaxID=1529436 RepID=UPI0014255469|nr:carbohydrate sulfotransferase 11-like [Anneissia japonica]
MRTCRITIYFRVAIVLSIGTFIYLLTSGKHHRPTQNREGSRLMMGFHIGPDGEPTNHQASIREMIIENVQLKRRRNLEKHCHRKPSNSLPVYAQRHTYVVDKYRLMYCFIPKVGCSNWKRIMMVLHGQKTNVDHLTSGEVHKTATMPFLTAYSKTQQAKKISNYTKFLFIRHPFKRLLSVYKNKFESLSYYRGNPHFHRYGKHIIKRWRENPAPHALDTGEGVTWPEFVDYLIHLPERKRFEKDDYFNDHWREMYKICAPCSVKYDFIGNLEDVVDESKYLLDRLHISDKVRYLSSDSSRPTNSSDLSTYNKYFGMLDNEQILGLWKIYKVDFLLFGYDKPDFVP